MQAIETQIKDLLKEGPMKIPEILGRLELRDILVKREDIANALQCLLIKAIVTKRYNNYSLVKAPKEIVAKPKVQVIKPIEKRFLNLSFEEYLQVQQQEREVRVQEANKNFFGANNKR